jgi:hypothetical protein
MTEETKHIYIFAPLGSKHEKYMPFNEKKLSVPPIGCLEAGYGGGELMDIKWDRLIFTCEHIKTPDDEKKLRSYDVLRGGPGGLILVNNLIMDCISHIIGKDIIEIPAEIHKKNGIIDGYHLIDIINTVSGVDKVQSTYSEFTGYLDKLVPKNKDFMNGHEMAREAEFEPHIYIIPSLREKILKAKKGKLKGLEMWTAKEDWEASHNVEKCPY